MVKSRLDEAPCLPEVFFSLAKEQPELDVYCQAVCDSNSEPSCPRQWHGTPYSEVRERVEKIGNFLVELGIARGDRIAILSSSRPEWIEADMGILSAGGVVVSVYQSLTAEDVGYILFDSGSEYIFAENQEQLDKLFELLEGPCSIPETDERQAQDVQISLKKIITFENTSTHPLVVNIEDVLKESSLGEPSAYKSLKREDLCSLVYTSGTTGPPKGVIQTHGNHLANCRQVMNAEVISSDSGIMLVLPLAHSFAKLMGYLGLCTTASIKFSAITSTTSSKLDQKSITRDMAESGATVFPLVPRILEKMQAGIQAKARSSKIVQLALWAAREKFEKGDRAGILAQLCFGGTAPIRAKIRSHLFGNSFRKVISGGAKLNPEVMKFFDGLEIGVYEGYGLTETCVATNLNRENAKKIGTVGPILADDIELRIAADGEICYRGPNIALGYYGREAATKASWDEDGWFHTGDLGSVDAEGFLTIEGRKKELIVTSYGKNIAPSEIELKISNSHYISNTSLIGEGRAYLIAIITVNVEALNSWAKREGVSIPESFHESQEVHDLIWSEVEKVNQELSSYETVKKILIAPEEFTVENGFLTPTFKVKRKVVSERFKNEIDKLY